MSVPRVPPVGTTPASAPLQPLVQGKAYAAQITAVRQGMVELLVGGRSLTASTGLRFMAQQQVQLQLVSMGADGIVFKLIGDYGQAAGSGLAAGHSLLRATETPADRQQTRAGELLAKHGLVPDRQSLAQISLLLREIGEQRTVAFMPELRALLSRNPNIDEHLLFQIAYSATATSAQDALKPLKDDAGRHRQQRERQPRKRANAIEVSDETLADGDTIREALSVWLGSPERVIAIALLDDSGTTTGGESTLLGALPNALNQSTGVSADLDPALIAWAEAQRVRTAIQPTTSRATLPIQLGAEATALSFEMQSLGGSYYEEDRLLRLKLLNETQGRVDIMLHLKGGAIRIDVCSPDENVVAAYSAELPRLKAQLMGSGVRLSEASCTRQVLPT
jgi:hypothetical protein